MSLQLVPLTARLKIPNSNGAVAAAGDSEANIRGEDQPGDVVLVPFQRAKPRGTDKVEDV
jgi:hypothetical protein